MTVIGLDHVAIPTAKPDEMLRFYRSLGFSAPTPEERLALNAPLISILFGENNINVHAPPVWQAKAYTRRRPTAQPGCGDFCFVWSGTVENLRATLELAGASVEEGPVERIGARNSGAAKGTSLYLRDPDYNLLEFIVYPPVE